MFCPQDWGNVLRNRPSLAYLDGKLHHVVDEAPDRLPPYACLVGYTPEAPKWERRIGVEPRIGRISAGVAAGQAAAVSRNAGCGNSGVRRTVPLRYTDSIKVLADFFGGIVDAKDLLCQRKQHDSSGTVWIPSRHYLMKSLRGLLKLPWAGRKDGCGFILVSSAGGDKRRPRRRAFCTFGHELESIHFADPDLDSLFTSHELSEHLRIVVAEVIRENDLRPHCFDRIDEHLVIHCVELGSKARIVNR